MAVQERKVWPPWWVLFVVWLLQIQEQKMVQISGATLAGAQSSQVLLNDGAVKKNMLKLKRGAEKDLDMGSAREIRERFPEYSYVDAYVRRIGNNTLFEEIKAAKEVVLKTGGRLSSAFWSNLRLKWQ